MWSKPIKTLGEVQQERREIKNEKRLKKNLAKIERGEKLNF
jgi:hypothetical protein